MRVKAIVFGVLVMFVVAMAGNSFSRVQDPEQEDVRGAFLTTRPKTTDKSRATRRPRRRPAATTASTPNPTASPGASPQTTAGTTSRKAATPRIGIGLTLFMRDSNGIAVRVEPSHEFHKGDAVRVLLETNADGHLYIFNTTDGGVPVMLYPDPQLDDGGNYLEAHVPFEIPASTATEERLRWFTFDERGGTERLYFIFTREPLSGVPIEDELSKSCADNRKTCAWHPTSELWAGLQKQMDAPVKMVSTPQAGTAQTTAEGNAVARGIGLAVNDPQPALIMMNASSSSGLLVTFLQMVHQ
jgi:hypothetical protein